MRTEAFADDLPPELIAQEPATPRDASRLLAVDRATGKMQHRHFADLPALLRPGDLLVANDSRVIPARLHARKPSGGRVEILLLTPVAPLVWDCLVGGKRVRPGLVLAIEKTDGITATVEIETDAGGRRLRFSAPLASFWEKAGEMPLPPYIHRQLQEPERYQTVYARQKGSAAAPTAGLHFTPTLMAQLQQKGIELAYVTLHVGLDTFRPIKETEIEAHQIHSEWLHLSAATAAVLNRARSAGRRIIAVGTTTTRVLESVTHPEALSAPAALLPWPTEIPPEGRDGVFRPAQGWTRLYIRPGFQFRGVDVLITNFHLPRSTLLLLVAAFAGKPLMDEVYRVAIEERYRFYSFGDACLFL